MTENEKEKFNFINWLRGKNTPEFLENLSFSVIAASAIMIAVGILLGSFVKYSVLLASVGSFLLLPSLIIFVISKLLQEGPSNNL